MYSARGKGTAEKTLDDTIKKCMLMNTDENL